MPALNLNFSDDEMAQLRSAAAATNQSLKAYAHRVVTDAASEYRRHVLEAGNYVAARSTELNKRLA